MDQQNNKQNLKTLLLKSLVKNWISFAVLLLLLASLVLAINYYGYQLTRKLYPVTATLYTIHDRLDENSILLEVWVDNQKPEVKKQLNNLMNVKLPELFNQLNLYVKQKKDKEQLNKIENQFSQLKRIQWRLMDIASSSGNNPAQLRYEKILTPLFNKIRQNIYYGEKQTSKKSAQSLFWIYDTLVKTQLALASYLKTASNQNLDKLNKSSSDLLNETESIVGSNSLVEETHILVIRYLNEIKTIIKLRSSPDWNAVPHELTNNYYPQRKVLHQLVGDFLFKKESSIKTIESFLFYLNLTTAFLVILILFLFFYFGYEFITKLSKRIVVPIELLIDEMKKAVYGKTSVLEFNSSIFELNQLIKTFKSMLNQRVISEQKILKGEKALNYLAYYDTLTRLPNQKFLDKQLGEDIDKFKLVTNRNKKIVLYHITLRNLELINNIWGEKTCDSLIQAFARQLSLYKPKPLFCASNTSKELVIYFKAESGFDLKQQTVNLIKYLKKSASLQEIEIHFTVGIAIYPDHSESGKQLIQYARFADSSAKREKHQYQIFNQEDKNRLTRQSVLERDLKKAIKEREIYLLYQPQFSLKDKKIIGFEALVRWNHHLYGEISPTEFIPIAEKSNQIVILGRFVQELALQQFSVWKQSYSKPLKLAINASLLELKNKRYIDFLDFLIQKYGLQSNEIEIEITESIISQQPEVFEQAIKDLRERGYLTVIDDFGKGYSTLERLSLLKVDLLKVDKVFVDNIVFDLDAKRLFSSIIKLAHSLGLPVIIEGIESSEQVIIAEQLNAEYSQGYYFSQALTPEEATQILLSKL